MARKTPSLKRKSERPIFDSIRKPNAPPGQPLSRSKPDEVARPAGRKAKHKRPPEFRATMMFEHYHSVFIGGLFKGKNKREPRPKVDSNSRVPSF